MSKSSKKQEKLGNPEIATEWVSVKDIAELMGVTPKTAQRRIAVLCAAGLGRIGNRFPLKEVKKLLEDWSHDRLRIG